MSREVIIDPEWEEDERRREADNTPPQRSRRHDSFELDDRGEVSLYDEDDTYTRPPRSDDALSGTDDDRAYGHPDRAPLDNPPFEPDDNGEVSLYDEDHTYTRPPRRDATSGSFRDADRSGRSDGYEADNTSVPPAEEDSSLRSGEEDQQQRPPKSNKFIGMLFFGNFLAHTKARRTYPYLILLAFMALIYIASRFHMHQLYRREINLTRQVKELRARSLDLSAKRMDATRRSFIMDEVARRGIPLEESLTTPKIIER